ncbi:MAG TPA: hypothetical protein DIT10_06400 [Chryseobacterium sp.]|nr:hypothetical protein [Chryseobacterium sp.]
MHFTIISYIEIITLFVAIIFLKKKNNGLLFSILVLNATAETLFSINNNLIGCVVLYCYLHFILWFLLFFKKIEEERFLQYIIPSFTFFCIVDFFYWEGTKSLNNYSFVLGTFIYVISFILFSFKFLKQEKFSWLLSNNYLLLISPILFFLGHSFMFAFDSQSLYYTKLFKNINLYPIVSYFVSIIYYSLINLYIYKENKSHV